MASREQLEAFLSEPRNVIVAGIRRDGRPQISPNWFFYDGERFYISTTRNRVKFTVFSRDPRVELVIDDATSMRAVLVSGTVEIREDLRPELARFRAIREKYGIAVPDEETQLRALLDEDRVLLAITPDRPPTEWTAWGFDG